jgi:hypothetical protein
LASWLDDRTLADWQKQYQSSQPRAGVSPVDPTPIPGGQTQAVSDALATTGSAIRPTITSPQDLLNLMFADPAYQTWKAGADQTLSGAAAARRAALRALVTNYGSIGGLSDVYGDVDQTTQDLAARNQYSQQQQLQRNYAQGVEAFKRGLAARGAMQSGDLQYGLDQADWQKGQLAYDQGQQFTSAAQKAINDYINTEAQMRMAEAQALSDAEKNVRLWWMPPSDEAPPPPSGSGQFTPPTVISGRSQPLPAVQGSQLGLGYFRPGGY